MQYSRKNLVKVTIRALVVLLVVAGVCLFSISGLKHEVTQLVQQTLPGLQYAAMADSLVCDNYVRCLNLISTPAENDLAETLPQIEQTARQIDVYLEKYRGTIFDQEDQANFKKVQTVRDEYVRQREKFFTLVKEQRRTDALHFFKSEVTTAYNNYSQSLRQMFEHKVKVGQLRREQVMLLSFMTPIIVGILFVLIFVLGLLLSLKFIVP